MPFVELSMETVGNEGSIDLIVGGDMTIRVGAGVVNGHRSFPGCGLPKFPTWQVLVSGISRRRDRVGSSQAGGRGV